METLLQLLQPTIRQRSELDSEQILSDSVVDSYTVYLNP